MPEPKNEAHFLHEILIILEAKFRAADVAADVPPTYRRRSADYAADVAADIRLSEHLESHLYTLTHSMACRQNIVA